MLQTQSKFDAKLDAFFRVAKPAFLLLGTMIYVFADVASLTENVTSHPLWDVVCFIFGCYWTCMMLVWTITSIAVYVKTRLNQ